MSNKFLDKLKGKKGGDQEFRTLRRRKISPTPYLMLIPAVIFFTTFTFYPFAKSIYLAFTVTNQKGEAVKWMGLYNFQFLFSQTDFWLIFKNTFIFAAIVGIGTFFIALLFAAISMDEKPGCRVYQTMFAIPMAIASAPASAIGMFIFKQTGLLNQMFNMNISWLNDTRWSLYAVAFLTIWLRVGSSFIFLLVGFRAVSREVIEGAIIDGAGPIRRFFKVVMPLASPQVFFVVFLNITGSFKAFGQIKMLTGGGPNHSSETLIYSIYRTGILSTRFERACAYSLILFIVIFIMTRIQFFLEKRLVFYK